MTKYNFLFKLLTWI